MSDMGDAASDSEGERMDGSGGQESARPAATSAGDDAPAPGEAAVTPDEPGQDTTESAAAKSGDDTLTSDAPITKTQPKAKAKRRSFWRELPVLVVVALVLALLIKTYAVQAFFIPSGSMENTLDIGDRVLINKLAYDFGSINRGDVVVFNGAGSWDPELSPPSSNPFTRFFTDIGQMIGVEHGEDDYVKRVIGVPGDRVACCNAKGQITVNGVALSEASYLYPGNVPSQERFSITVPPGRLWVMGDHREISYDSRDHMGDPGGGTIPENEVLGKVFVRIWPLNRLGFIGSPSTFNQPKLTESLGSSVGDVALKAAGLPELPLVLGFAAAVPLTVGQRKLRRRLATRRRRS
jgi:signal peptidase I